MLLIALAGGGQAADLASLVPVDAYFQSRGVEVTVSSMLELAGKDPVDGKTQIAQLLALRSLGDEPAKIKRHKDYARVVELLKEISGGKKAQDSFGFARDHAARTLARLEDKALLSPARPKNSVRDEAFRWFPADATIIGCIDEWHVVCVQVIRSQSPTTKHLVCCG
jgi:hypothetical protein